MVCQFFNFKKKEKPLRADNPVEGKIRDYEREGALLQKVFDKSPPPLPQLIKVYTKGMSDGDSSRWGRGRGVERACFTLKIWQWSKQSIHIFI